MHTHTPQSYWKDPEYLLYELNINSVILAPQHGEHLPVHCSTDQYLLQGYAYTGGGRKIRRVEISLDGGVSWQNTTVKYPDGYTPRHGVRWWVMSRWELSVPTWKLLQCSETAVRAWDSSLNTQPNTIKWNLLGMMNNSYYRVKLQVIEPQAQHHTNNTDANSADDAPVIEFLHPVSQTGRRKTVTTTTAQRAKHTA
eukprot:1844-Heterococcus_DN1.PRE.4